MINVALVGTWHVHFKGYAEKIANNPNCKITALWDNDTESGKKAAEKFGCDVESGLGGWIQSSLH